MASTSNTITKILIFLLINGAILYQSEASPPPNDQSEASPPPDDQSEASPPPSGTSECYNNLTGECRNAVMAALCQETEMPVGAMVNDLCCLELQTNVNANCITSTMVRDVKKKQCKKDKKMVKMRSKQIWMYCMDSADTSGLEEMGY